MANVAQCVFCFEVLSAELEKRKRLSLAQVTDLWSKYQASLRSLAGPEAGESAAEPEQAEDGEDEEPEDSESERHARPLQPSGIARLQAKSPANSSGGSTPSTNSASSSSTILSAASKASSTSAASLFSFGRSPVQQEPEYPVFVTWNEYNARGSKSLRGCVGTFEAAPLSHNLETYAITSALNDHRFSPVASSELPRLSVSLTLLTNFTPCDNALDWTLGTHGLRLSFTHHGRRYGATYLPDVAPEQGWSKEETVVSLMRKAGWNGSRREWSRVADLKAVRYEGIKASVPWKEYRAWRDWLKAEKLA